MRKTRIKQDRWACRWCGASGWWTPSTHIGRSPTEDHCRPDGKVCRLAGKSKEQVWAIAMDNGMPLSGRSS